MIINITLMILLIAIIIFVFRLILINDIHDKLLSLNLLTIKVILFLSVLAIYKDDKFILDIAVASSMIGFIATAILIVYFGKDDKIE
ncbi:MAG: hypothetical protein JW702_00130 [Clostridiales bacterium]|nr:hypothetical protein [Clostridiales bacterium]